MTSVPFADWPRPLAFALSGGGSYGATQVGMLQALAEAKVVPDLVVGTSVGALNGVTVADNPDDAHIRLSEVWHRMDRRTIFGGSRRSMVASLIRRSGGLCRPDQLEALIEAQLSARDFSELAVPFCAVATDLDSGEPELLTTGPLRPALLASAAIPGVFPAVSVGGRPYADGGLSANVPIRQAIAFGAGSVIVLDANPALVPGSPSRSLVGGLARAVAVMLRNQRAHAVDDILGRYPVAMLPQSTPPDVGSFDFNRTGELMDVAYRRATAFLAAVPSEPIAST